MKAKRGEGGKGSFGLSLFMGSSHTTHTLHRKELMRWNSLLRFI